MFERTERGLLARWWWTIDRAMLSGLGLLVLAGLIFVFASSPPVAVRLELPSQHFVVRHVLYLLPAALILFTSSLLSPRGIRRLAPGLFALAIVMLVLTLLVGPEIKGATRWLPIGGIVIQPGEFAKPALAVLVASVLANAPGILNAKPALLACGLVVLLLLAQPDVGMALNVSGAVAVQFFIAGLPWLLVVLAAALGCLGLWQAYQWFPHVSQRVDRFLDPSSGDHYQVGTALEAVRGAAWFGSGPGEGNVKYVLPDAHSDFVFAVIAEEFGLIACLALIGLIAFILVRGLSRAQVMPDRFTILAAAGLLSHLGIQTIVNLGVSLSLLPATGMTLPFVSYGGSALCAMALSMGMLLALTRRRPSSEAEP